MCLRRTVICGLSGYSIYTLSHKQRKYLKRINWITIIYFEILYKYVWNFSNSKRTERDKSQNVYLSSCKETVFVVITHKILNSLDGFSKNNVISNFIDIGKVGSIFFHVADRQTLGRADRNFCEFRIHLQQFSERARKKRLSMLSGFEDC